MMKRLLLFGLATAMLASATAAFAINVVVNGQILPAYPPGIMRAERVLLPMRVIFESLGAEVRWESATQSITAVQGDRIIRMAIGQNTAYINDRPVPLDVPPMLVNDLTYVPVRFPAEALGADVAWNDAAQTVNINLPIAQLPGPAPLPSPQPVSQGGAVSGVISAITGNRLALTVDSQLRVYNIDPSTIILSQGQQVALSDLRSGEFATIDFDASGMATTVRASFQTIRGTVQAATPNQILLESQPQPFRILPQLEVTTENGAPASLSDIRAGDIVTLQVTPNTDDVYAIVVEPRLAEALTVDIGDVGVLVPGDVVRVSASGPPGGQATLSFGSLGRDIPLREARPGLYEGRFTVPSISESRDEFATVSLHTAAGRTLTARSPQPVQFAAARDLTPTIIHPLQGEPVSSPLVVEGYTEPQAVVEITITWRGAASDGYEESGQLSRVRVTADGFGRFRTRALPLEVNSRLPREEVRYTITAVAHAPGGVASSPVEVDFFAD